MIHSNFTNTIRRSFAAIVIALAVPLLLTSCDSGGSGGNMTSDSKLVGTYKLVDMVVTDGNRITTMDDGWSGALKIDDSMTMHITTCLKGDCLSDSRPLSSVSYHYEDGEFTYSVSSSSGLYAAYSFVRVSE